MTVLTRFSNFSIKKVGHTKSIKDLVRKQALLARTAKLDGIVCSAHEIKFIKKVCKKMEIITPGIRFKGENLNDQKRVMTPAEAFKNGATSIVMGRSLVNGNIKNNIKKLIKSLNTTALKLKVSLLLVKADNSMNAVLFGLKKGF